MTLRDLVRALPLMGAAAAVPLASAGAVPSFTRQTGLACYQCHVTFGAPVPDFTWTGMKFRITGYRLPWAGEKFEAGEEGAVSGNRMALTLTSYLAFRFNSTFAQQTRAPGSDDWGNVISNPTSRFAVFPGGPFGDYFSLWAELYATPDGSPTQQWNLGNVSYQEFDLRITRMFRNAVVGLAFATQGPSELAGFGPWPVGLTDHIWRGSYRGWANPNRGILSAYGWFNDRVFAAVSAGPGEDNFDWDRAIYAAQVGVAFLNRDDRDLWLWSAIQFGDDGIPILTDVRPSTARPQTWDYIDVVNGLSDLRPGGGVYMSQDMDKSIRSNTQLRYGFVDRGPHSLRSVLQLSLNSEDYLDGAQAIHNAIGGSLRYTFNRTWGFDLSLDHTLDLQYTDPGGAEFDIDTPTFEYTSYLSFRPTSNMLFYLSYGNNFEWTLETAATTGRTWGLVVDFLF